MSNFVELSAALLIISTGVFTGFRAYLNTVNTLNTFYGRTALNAQSKGLQSTLQDQLTYLLPRNACIPTSNGLVRTYTWSAYTDQDLDTLRPDLALVQSQAQFGLYARTVVLTYNPDAQTLDLQAYYPSSPNTSVVDPSIDPASLRWERTWQNIASFDVSCVDNQADIDMAIAATDRYGNRLFTQSLSVITTP
ncbi:hypothetical protein [Anthocerotibacter panamensis]|uniref:hypothetical protein n=1 Tax=Anthocerotibacter panamensis TaxID=2857077 RepID=UPI001C406465|nr:hypothetical protein [Anthocerotibacter panamensis]